VDVVAGEQVAEHGLVDAVQTAQEASEAASEARERRLAEQRPSGEQLVGQDAETPVGEARLRHRYGHAGREQC
jgi:thioesterase domain-containing protein